MCMWARTFDAVENKTFQIAVLQQRFFLILCLAIVIRRTMANGSHKSERTVA